MSEWKEQRLRAVRDRAEREARILAGEFARAAAEDRELILAALEHEQWLATGCRDLLDARQRA